MVVRFIRRLSRSAFSTLALSGLAAGVAAGGWPGQSRCCPPSCPAPSVVESTPSPTPSPTPTPSPESESPFLGEIAGGATGGEVAALTSPNMFGDAFGSQPVILRFQATVTRPFVTVLGGRFSGNIGATLISNPNATLNGTSLGSVAYFLVPPGKVPGGPPVPDVALLENTSVTAAVAAGAALPGETTLFVTATGVNGSTTPAAPNFTSYDVALQYLFQSQRNLQLVVPTPAELVGRTKISEDNSPLPRDRFILDYDYFNNVPIRIGDTDVRRWSPGIEKTFLDRMASIEVRFPFASTLDSNISVDGIGGGHTEFGNLQVTTKALLWSSDAVNVAVGLGINLPTADDMHVRLSNGTDLVVIRNDSVFLTPYVAALLTPNDRCFAQAWLQFGVDANGNPISVNPGLGGLRTVGRLTDQSLLQADLQVGYWLMRHDETCCLLRGLAPFVELHYNSTVSDADHIHTGNLTISTPVNNTDELNVTAGVVAQVGDNLNVSAGVVLPLRDSPDRSFDYQIGVRANWFFGPTARARSAASQVSGF